MDATSFHIADLRDLVLQAAPNFQEGSLQLFYRGHDLMLGAQVKMVNEEHSVSFDEQLYEPTAKYASSRLEGLWWVPSNKCELHLVVSNTTNSPISVSASVEGTAPKQKAPAVLTLQPHETRLLDVQQDLIGHKEGKIFEVGAISIEHTGPKGALLARGMVQEASKGYSSVIEFSDPAKAKSSKLHGAGLRLGTVAGETLRPVIVAHNIANGPATLTGRIPYTGRDGRLRKLALADVQLAAGEVRLIGVPASINREIKAAGLEFEYISPPGTVIMSAMSVSKSGNHVFRVPLLDPAAQQSSTGGYPWMIDETSSTVVYVKNVTDEPQEYVLELLYPGGSYTLGIEKAEAGQTAVVDIRQLRHSQQVDENGQVIPKDATGGQVHWSLRGDPEDLVLIGRAEQVDVAKGLSSTYACQNCCGDTFYAGSCLPSTVVGVPGNTNQFTAREQDRDCYRNLRTPFTVSASWSSDDTTVATVNSSGLATARAPGETYIRASWTAIYGYYPGYSCVAQTYAAVASAFCQVVEITDISPQILNVSTGDPASTHNLYVSFTPANASPSINFTRTLLHNVGGTQTATLTVPSQSGTSPVTTTVKAGSADSSGAFAVRPGIGGTISPKESRVVVPPQRLLQMMRNEARGLSSSTVRILLGWSLRNRFNDSAFFAGQSTYQAAIAADATRDLNLTTGEQPELDAAASVFDGFTDQSEGCQGFWSPTPDQWTRVQAAIGSNTLPNNVGAPAFISSYPRQYIYFPSVGNNPIHLPRLAPSFLFVRKRPAGQPAVVQINN